MSITGGKISFSGSLSAILYIKVLQNLNQIVDLMLRVVGHVPRVSHVTVFFTQFWGTMRLISPPTQTLGDVSPNPNGLTFLGLYTNNPLTC